MKWNKEMKWNDASFSLLSYTRYFYNEVNFVQCYMPGAEIYRQSLVKTLIKLWVSKGARVCKRVNYLSKNPNTAMAFQMKSII